MEKKMKRIPFDLERAKRITNGEEEGRVVLSEGNRVRILAFDRKNDEYPIIGMIEEAPDFESIQGWTASGKVHKNLTHKIDLVLEVPDDTPACEFKPFDKVLVRNSSEQCWRANIFSHFSAEDEEYDCISGAWNYCIPYNDDTAHLLGTNEDWEG